MKLSAIVADGTFSCITAPLQGSYEAVIRQASEIGFDAVQLTVNRPQDIDPALINRLTAKYGLTVSAIATGMGYTVDGLSLGAGDELIRRKAVERMRGHVDLASELGNAMVIIGAIRGRFSDAPTPDIYFRQLHKSIREAVDYAEQKGVIILLEASDRLETEAYITIRDTAAYIRAVNSPSLRLQLDTMHMLYENEEIHDQIIACADITAQVDISGEDRLCPTQCDYDYPTVISTLKESGFQGVLAFEHRPAPPEDAAKASYQYIRKLLDNEGVNMYDFGTHHYIEVGDGVTIHAVTTGEGAPLLLLHGHPETYLMWHKTASQLSKRFTVVAADLRGYGESGKPADVPDHSNYSKRVMAEDMISLMRTLGFEKFHVIGHDRGARVGYRMALDHPEVVDKLVLLDIVSTYDMYALSDREFSKALFQWYFFTQQAPLPEDMILASREQFFRFSLHIARYENKNDTAAEAFPKAVYDEYLRRYTPGVIHAICEEYRAGETVDLILDQQDLDNGKQIQAPTLVLWGSNGLVERFFKPLECWAKFGGHIQGHALPCGHFIPEEAPIPMLKVIEEFL